MASTDGTHFPLYGQAYRLQGAIRNPSTLQVVTGGLGTLAGTISKDSAASAATATPVEIGTEGIFYVDLTAANMTANVVTVIVTASTANTEDFTATIYPVKLTEITGRADAATVKRLENFIVQLWGRFFNKMTVTDAGAVTQYQSDSTTSELTGANTNSSGTETRGKLT